MSSRLLVFLSNVHSFSRVFPALKSRNHACVRKGRSLVWVRDSLTSYCVSLEDEERREGVLSASRRRGRSAGAERTSTAHQFMRFPVSSADFVPWYKLL